MSELSIIPNIDPVQIILDDNYKLLIRAAYRGGFVVCITDNAGQYVNIPDKFEVYDINNQRYWDMQEDIKFHAGSLFGVYEIYYNFETVLNNYDYCTMEDYCGFPFTSNKYYPNFYTALCNGTVKKDSNSIKVSSTMDLDIGLTISGKGIPEFTTITMVDDESNFIQVNQNIYESGSNITLTVR
jgi:hypothetical protein